MFGRKKTPISGRIDTLIARSARLQGDIEFTGGLHLEGHVIGNVRATSGESATLWISEQGVVEGAVDVPSLVVNGAVNGDVQGRERVVIGSTARIHGNVHYGTIEMALGAQVSGKLIPITAKTQAAASGGAGAVGKAVGEPAAGTRDPADLPPAAVNALFDARRSGT
jgi:cytoskeletal protein CcmA (bactofilin family)